VKRRWQGIHDAGVAVLGDAAHIRWAAHEVREWKRRSSQHEKRALRGRVQNGAIGIWRSASVVNDDVAKQTCFQRADLVRDFQGEGRMIGGHQPQIVIRERLVEVAGAEFRGAGEFARQSYRCESDDGMRTARPQSGATSPEPVHGLNHPIGDLASLAVGVTKADHGDDSDPSEKQGRVATFRDESPVQSPPAP
jgi:hypothetical protein